MQDRSTKPQPRKSSNAGGGAAVPGNAHPAKAGSVLAGRRAQDSTKGPQHSSGADKDDVLTPAALVHLSTEHTNQLRQAFDLFDSAGTGRIKVSEVKVAFYALGYDVNSIELDRVLRDVGVVTVPGPSGEEPTMDFNDFYNVLLRRMTEKESRVESVRAFTQIDEDEKGYIALEDLREIADSLHMELTDDELVEMMLFAQSTTAGSPTGSGGTGNVAAEFGAKESLAVTEDQFLKLLKRANVF